MPAADAGDKLGEQIARDLELRIRDQGWRHDHYLGHEEALARNYGVSRSIFREAVAIGEWQGFVKSRRGRDGGLYVQQASAQAAKSALRNYLFLIGATLEEMLGARRIVDSYMLGLTVRRLDARHAEGLSAMLREPAAIEHDRLHLSRLKRIVDQMATIADLPMLAMFSGSLRHCYVDRVRASISDDARYLATSATVARLRMQQIEAVIALDLVAALDLQTRALDAWAAFQADVAPDPLDGANIVARLMNAANGGLIYEFVEPVKKTEAVARALAQRISAAGMAPGDRLGGEAALIGELGVGRRVFREAVRILERFGVVEMGRGKHGGLCVGRPRPEPLLTITRRSLASGVADQPREHWLLFASLSQAALRRAMARPATGSAIARVRAAERASPRELFALLAELSGDRVVECLLLVVQDAMEVRCPVPDELLDAIASGDAFAAARGLTDIVKRSAGPHLPLELDPLSNLTSDR